MSLRVGLITYNWPPRNAIGTFRAYSWAKYWAEENGVEVFVFTPTKQAFDAPLDLHLPISSRITVFQIESTKPPTGSVLGKSKKLMKLGRALNSWLKIRLGLVLDPRDYWIAPACQKVDCVAANLDVIVSTHGPRSTHLIASHVRARHPHLKWIADYRDLWSQNHLASYGPTAQKREAAIERRAMKEADAFITVSDELAAQLETLVCSHVHVIPNGFDPEDYLGYPDAPTHEDPPRLVYTGMLYRQHRDPSPLFQALSELHQEGAISPGDIHVDFYGPPDSWLDELINRFGVHPFVNLMGRVQRPDALKAQSRASALLLIESAAPEARGVLTGKLFEYLAMGKPILSLGSPPGSAIGRVLSSTATGLIAENDVQKVKSFLLSMMKREPLKWHSPRKDVISQFSRPSQAKQVLQIMQNLMAKSGD
ncbi:glycosyltransferase [Pigmentiphaga kullae]|uniref:Glycosyltransferase involved in cell wall biosynthesis n=1 Tax=Pigmentiphaga kullae TaxID=151784 RepID=A0A4Q7NLW4_9BURK|nr:glycosyltransferase [Pigmentiphaga kullae]RZS85972.1 glycosyltransferase involved in cell wall biosynthesis [Pigmentiphaga kullae]